MTTSAAHTNTNKPASSELESTEKVRSLIRLAERATA